jgi:2-polyprenyl-6-hydroxyphenyl methylase/3-demethylubiquinone-9 3-methyltransferase
MTTATLNIDHREVNKFNNLAARWWDRNGECKPLHDINPLRLDYISQYTDLKEKNIIDVGCGGGILSEGLAQRGATVTAIDMSEAALTVAKLHLFESNLQINYQQTTVEQWAEKHPQQYDVVTCMEMLEHVPNPASVILACSQLVKPEGKIFFSTLNRHWKSYLMAILGAEYVLQLLPKGTHDYAHFIKPAELAQWIRAADLELKHLTGMTYQPFSQTYHLTNDLSTNYLGYAIKSL